MAEALDIPLPEEEEYDTLGGLVFGQLSVIPEDGSQFEVDALGLHIKVEDFTDPAGWNGPWSPSWIPPLRQIRQTPKSGN